MEGTVRRSILSPNTTNTKQLTCLIGIVGYFALVDFPDRAAKTSLNFLNENECNFIVRRINKDRDDATITKFNLGLWARSGLDFKIWGFAMIFLSVTLLSVPVNNV